MKKRVALYAVLCLVCVLMSSVFCPFTVNGVGPRYLLCAVVCVGLMEDNRVAAVLGLVFGLIAGLSGSTVFGLTAVLYGVVGWLCGKWNKGGYGRAFFTTLILCSAVTVLADLPVAGVNSLLYSQSFFSMMYYVTLPKLFLTAVVSCVVFAVVLWISTSRLWRNVDEEY